MRCSKVCPRCGSNLGHGEVCDCLTIEAELLEAHVGKKEPPAGAANTDEGKVEQNLTTVSASNDTTD